MCFCLLTTVEPPIMSCNASRLGGNVKISTNIKLTGEETDELLPAY